MNAAEIVGRSLKHLACRPTRWKHLQQQRLQQHFQSLLIFTRQLQSEKLDVVLLSDIS